MKQKIKAVWVIISIVVLGAWLWQGDKIASGQFAKEFVPGLDLAGGSALTYTIETGKLPKEADIKESVESLRDVIERRVNLFGVREPTVTTAFSRIAQEWRLIIELPGVTNVQEATKLIGETPVLEFRTLRPGMAGVNASTTIGDFESSPLTGTYLKKTNLVFDQNTNRPMVELNFDDTGAKLFAAITKANVGREVAIFLDGLPISSPVVNEEITGGKAVISGNFSIEEARILVGRLNSGALPVPITLSGTTVVGPALGEKAIGAGVKASIIGFLLIALFMIFWYRLPGFLAVIALASYTTIMLALFKLIPVTLTAAGIAGFIISLGLAVDANVLTFERMKEELRSGKSLSDAMEAGFMRAWTSIRDSHLAAIIVSIILFWFGTSIVKGFAFTFFLGAVVSLFSAQIITRTLLRAVVVRNMGKASRFLFSSGFFKN
ncbi:MAG: preprotein translocase subunit SecD [Patescibacteria group bacterium]|nr:preprotein translocase subunit SecD [Patescibacteria group bacterium]